MDEKVSVPFISERFEKARTVEVRALIDKWKERMNLQEWEIKTYFESGSQIY